MNAADPFGLVGQVLDGQFRVDKLVGEGGFSAVYRGHHQGLNEPIAIKCLKLPPSLGSSLVDTFVQRFRDESRILYRLSQGNLHIVRSIAAGTTQAPATGLLVPYMVLEWLEGRSVQNDFIVRRTVGEKGRSVQEVLKLFDTAADGLAYAHAQGVVHRDLNPGNLFLANTQHGVKMKVLDFGVAKLMHDGALNMGPRQHTVGQIKIFAPAYGAPEQFDDRIGAVGAASDVYSFALILMEALRDRTVVEGSHLGEFAQITTNPEKRPTPRALGIDVPDEVEQAFARATVLDPAQRWHSAGDFWQSLTIALKLATERKYENAARETPPLAMSAQGAGPPAPGRTPLAKTLPLNAVMPGGLPRPAGAGAARPRVATTIGIPAPAGASRTGTLLTPQGPQGPQPPQGPQAPQGTGAGTAPTATPAGRGTSPMGPGPARPATPASASAPLAPPRATNRPPASPRSPSLPSVPSLGTPPPPQVARSGSAPEASGEGAGKPPEADTLPPPIEDEEAEEATKVHAPGPDVLRTLALQDAVNVANARAAAKAAEAQARSAATLMQGGDQDVSALAAAARESVGRPPAMTPVPDSPMGGTLMMSPAANPARHAIEAAAAAQQQQEATLARPFAPVAPPPAHPATAPYGSPVRPGAGGNLGATIAMAAAPQQTPGLPFAPSPAPPPVQQTTEPMKMQHLQSTQAMPARQAMQALQSGNAHGGQGGQGPGPVPFGQGSTIVAPAAPLQGQTPGGAPPFGSGTSAPPSRQSTQRAMSDAPFPPPSFAQGPDAAPPKSPLPLVPIAIALAVLALGGVVLGVMGLRARHTTPPDPTGMTSSSSEAPSLTPVPVPVPVTADTPSVPSVAVEVDAAPAAVVEEADAGAPAVEAATATGATTATAAPTTTAAPTATATATSLGVATGAPPMTPPTATAVPIATAKPAADPNAFSESAARTRLSQANGVLVICKKEGGVTGPGNASVTFGNDGSVSALAIDPPFAATPAGDCVANQLRRAKVSPFTGSPQTLRFGFEVPK